jgi:hypothetical protein
MSSSPNFTRFMIAVLAFTLCGVPQILVAQQTPDATAGQQNSTTQSGSGEQSNTDPQPEQAGQAQATGSTRQSATPDPSKGPLAPAESQLPNAPSSSQAQEDSTSSSKATAQPTRPQEAPVGVGAAQAGRVSGGAASRPAGTAIAPAKQRQTRSLLIKVGAIAAGAAAFGIVYGLSRSSPSKPPGSASGTAPTVAARP